MSHAWRNNPIGINFFLRSPTGMPREKNCLQRQNVPSLGLFSFEKTIWTSAGFDPLFVQKHRRVWKVWFQVYAENLFTETLLPD